MKVLVADDDPSIRLLVKTMVQELGHEVIVAAGGVEAWDQLSASPANVVVIDWLMPDLDGLELCRRIRARVSPEYTYVILLTALDARSHYLAAIEAGVDDFLSKPFDPDLMAARLQVAEDRRGPAPPRSLARAEKGLLQRVHSYSRITLQTLIHSES